jgi:hypothetical protein
MDRTAFGFILLDPFGRASSWRVPHGPGMHHVAQIASGKASIEDAP